MGHLKAVDGMGLGFDTEGFRFPSPPQCKEACSMAIDDEDDLFNEEFDLVDDDDYEDDDSDSSFDNEDDSFEEVAEEEPEEKPAKKPKRKPAKKKAAGRGRRPAKATAEENGSAEASEDAKSADEQAESAEGEQAATEASETEGEDLDEFGRPKPEANYVVHLYEHKNFKRTIERPFTPEDAEAFATEFNRTGKVYGRMALAGKNDAKPKKSVD